jgi:hypothetical protein
VRAGAQRLHGLRFPPFILKGCLDGQGPQAPKQINESQPQAVCHFLREDSNPKGRDVLRLGAQPIAVPALPVAPVLCMVSS